MFVTKPGEHGTLTRFAVYYRDPDPCSPEFVWCCWAYSSEHAREKFEADGDDWIVNKIVRVRAS